MNSILQQEKECFICHAKDTIENHHCIHGTANRKVADTYGLTVYLCHTCHTKVHDKDRRLDLMLIQYAQREFEKTHSREEFRQLFGKSWL